MNGEHQVSRLNRRQILATWLGTALVLGLSRYPALAEGEIRIGYQKGSANLLVLKSGGSVVPDEPWAIADAIHQHYLARTAAAGSRTATQPWMREEVRRYDRRILAGRLAMHLAGEAS